MLILRFWRPNKLRIIKKQKFTLRVHQLDARCMDSCVDNVRLKEGEKETSEAAAAVIRCPYAKIHEGCCWTRVSLFLCHLHIMFAFDLRVIFFSFLIGGDT